MAAEAPLKLQQLTHEVEVGGHTGTSRLHKVVSRPQVIAEALHDVGHADSGRAGHAGMAVDQHSPSTGLHTICREQERQCQP